MIRFQNLIGKQVISIQEGKNFGKVIDVFVNTKDLTVDGLIISDKDDRFLPHEEIKNIDDSVIFSSGEKLLSLSEKGDKDLRKGSSINGLKIITEKGMEKGRLVSFYFKKNSGIISHFEIEKNILMENLIMSRDGVLRVGEDAVIIYEEAAEVMQGMKKRNNIKISIKKIGKSVEVFTKSVFNRKLLEELKDKSGKILKKTKNGTLKLKDAVEKTINKIKKIKVKNKTGEKK